MSMKPPITDLDIKTESSGFYEGFSKFVTVGSKASIGMLIFWAIVFQESAGNALKALRATIDANRGSRYMYIMGFYIVVCLGLAIWPATGKIRLGGDDRKPEFSNFCGFR